MIDSEVLSGFYWYCAIIGTIVFVIKTALPIHSGTEISADFTSLTDSDSSFGLFTVEGISAFFMCSGWMGCLAYDHLKYGLEMSAVVALISGILGMVFFTWLISVFKKLEHTPKVDLNELVDKTGKAYLKFAPRGAGKIEIELNSKLSVIDAYNDSDVEINVFDLIKVTRVENDNVYIVKE